MFYLNTNNKIVYYSEIIHPKEFEKLYLGETAIFSFSSKINIGSRAFITFLARDRKSKFNKGDILLIRLLKGSKEAQFVTKLGEYGRLNTLKEFINLLKIKNHEKINF